MACVCFWGVWDLEEPDGLVCLPFTRGFYRGRTVGNELQVGVGRFLARQETHQWSILSKQVCPARPLFEREPFI